MCHSTDSHEKAPYPIPLFWLVNRYPANYQIAGYHNPQNILKSLGRSQFFTRNNRIIPPFTVIPGRKAYNLPTIVYPLVI